MLGNGVSHLVTDDNRQFVVAAGKVHNTFIHNDFAAGHTPSVDVVTLDQIELPSEVLELALESGITEIGLGSGGDALANTGDFGTLGLVSGNGGRLHEGGILLETSCQHLLITDKIQLFAAGNGYRTAAGEQHGCYSQHSDNLFHRTHKLILIISVI